VTAVMEMSRAISGEMILDRLIERLMATVVKYASADRGLLLLPQQGGIRLVAEAETKSEAVAVTLVSRGDVAAELPASVLDCVVRTHETVILDDALTADGHAEDAYVLRARPRSVLSLPLVKQGQLVGVLYLENGLSSHLFTPDRLAILRLLVSQAAVSIENAKLFRDLQKAQAEVRRAGAVFRQAFDMIPALAWSTSKDGTFEYANKQWHDYTGISHEAAVSGAWMYTFHPDDIEKVVEKWHELLKSGSAGEIEARMCRADGSFRSFLVRATPVRDADGNVAKWYGTNTDIEELRRAEATQEALARKGRLIAMGELTVSIAHEVNQPLAAITTNAAACLSWLSHSQPNLFEARQAAEAIRHDGRRAADIIASIRSLARKSPTEMGQLNLNELIQEVLVLMRGEFDRRRIVAKTDLAADLGAVLGDRVRIQQVIINLTMNGIEAISAVQEPSRVLEIRSGQADPGYVEIAISDTGVGLDPANSDKIFDAFFTTKPEGIGMGLSICRSIVEAHSGRLWASPNLPRGCIFHFTVRKFTDGPRIASAGDAMPPSSRLNQASMHSAQGCAGSHSG
jgi:PAS domain S-box-containing protein